MKYFFSHSSKDKLAVELLVQSIQQYDPEAALPGKVFCSSIPENGSDFKEELITNINRNISEAENIILIITDNFIRSSFCFYELSMARYLQASDKKVILIVQNAAVAAQIDDIFPAKTFLHISAEAEIAAETLVRSLGYPKTSSAAFARFFLALRNGMPATGTAFIGMSKDAYDTKYGFVEKFGVEKLCFDYPSTPEAAQAALADAREIYFVSTTGSGFLKTYKETLSSCVANGCDLSLLISDLNSPFSTDVAELEAFDRSIDYEPLKQNNQLRIASEFQATFQYLNEIFTATRHSHTAGSIRCGSSYTLIRQTVLIARKENGEFWGWITCTMPPARSADQTPSIVFKGDAHNTLVSNVWNYAATLFSLAEKRGGVVRIDGVHTPERLDNSTEQTGFKEALAKAEAYWTERYSTAQAYMTERAEMFDEILIEVAAQHPLKNRTVPNKEFEARLDKAAELYHRYTEQGRDVTVYVPGSRHQFNGVADQLPLSTAGVNYLLGKGIPAEHLIGDDANNRYKPEHGVYNSADECFVASEIFKNGQFDTLVCVCSPNQIMRKTLLYIEFGCIPLCYGVTTEKMHHKNIINEVFRSLNRVLYEDHSWQDENSTWFQYFRQTRKPPAE